MVKAKGIVQHYFVTGMGETPARIDSAGNLFLNADMWPNLDANQRMFVMLHEEGHLALDTSNEKLVDAYAWKKYEQLGYPISGSVLALSRNLSGRSSEHQERVLAQLKRALSYDGRINGNTKALKTLSEIEKMEHAAYVKGRADAERQWMESQSFLGLNRDKDATGQKKSWWQQIFGGNNEKAQMKSNLKLQKEASKQADAQAQAAQAQAAQAAAQSQAEAAGNNTKKILIIGGIAVLALGIIAGVVVYIKKSNQS